MPRFSSRSKRRLDTCDSKLEKLFKEVELAELNDELAYDGAMDYQEPPF